MVLKKRSLIDSEFQSTANETSLLNKSMLNAASEYQFAEDTITIASGKFLPQSDFNYPLSKTPLG